MENVKFFSTQSALHKWYLKNHNKAPEQWIGFHKVSTGKKSITYSQALDEALAFGWIDGIRKGIDETSYVIRYTPRRPGSVWSAVNIRRAGELIKLGVMQPAGLEAFKRRRDDRSAIYAYENKDKKLSAAYEKKFRQNKKAWKFFQAQAPWYKRTASYWVINAKQEATKLKRLETLIKDSQNGQRIAHLQRTNSRNK